jgi:hypothetical protein
MSVKENGIMSQLPRENKKKAPDFRSLYIYGTGVASGGLAHPKLRAELTGLPGI